MRSTDFWHVVRDSVWKIVWVTLFTYRSAKIYQRRIFLVSETWLLMFQKWIINTKLISVKAYRATYCQKKKSTWFQFIIFRSCLSLKLNFLKMIYIKALSFPFWFLIRWRLSSFESHILKYTCSFHLGRF